MWGKKQEPDNEEQKPETPANKGESPRDSEAELSMEDLNSFFNSLKSSNDMQAQTRMYVEKAQKLITSAIQMVEDGAEADTPLAKLWSEDIIAASITGIMMSPTFTDFEKLRLIMALTVVSMREYEITLY